MYYKYIRGKKVEVGRNIHQINYITLVSSPKKKIPSILLEAIGQSIKSAGDDQNFPLILPDTPALPILLNITDLFLLNKEIPFPNLLNSYVHTCPFFLFCWY